jgi:hypothetical protein
MERALPCALTFSGRSENRKGAASGVDSQPLLTDQKVFTRATNADCILTHQEISRLTGANCLSIGGNGDHRPAYVINAGCASSVADAGMDKSSELTSAVLWVAGWHRDNLQSKIHHVLRLALPRRHHADQNRRCL